MKNKMYFIIIIASILLLSMPNSTALLTTKETYENNPPSDPIIDGPSKVRVGELHEWTITSTDPEGSDITYYFDWGDHCGASWYGPYPSGEVVVLPHTYSYVSTYIINAMAMDDESTESGWTYFDIEVVKSRTVNNPLLKLLEKYPVLSKMFHFLL